MFAEPATGGTPDEQPGAMPEIFPSPDQGANIDRCWTCRSMFMQAWGNYGTAWAVVHQWLGVRPDLGHGRGRRSCRRCRRARPRCRDRTSGSATGRPTCWPPTTGNLYRTEIDTTKGVGADKVVIGHTLPRGAAARHRRARRPQRCTTTRFARPTAEPR